MPAFEQAFAILLPYEGGYDTNPDDPGNWTGGAVGAGRNLGTNYGVDSGSYDIVLSRLPLAIAKAMPMTVKDLTLEQAKTIYRYQYWNLVRGDDLPPPLALLVFDAAVNNGVSRAVQWLQYAVSTAADGRIGPVTMAALTKSIAEIGINGVCAEFQARRIDFMGGLPTWQEFGLGWSRRLAKLLYQTLEMVR